MAEELQAAHPTLVTAAMTKAKRPGKVFLDWSQNSGSKTTVSPYSLRGRALPTVATPMTWDEVEAGAEDPLGLDQFRFEEVLERVQRARRPLPRLSAEPARRLLPNGGADVWAAWARGGTGVRRRDPRFGLSTWSTPRQPWWVGTARPTDPLRRPGHPPSAAVAHDDSPSGPRTPAMQSAELDEPVATMLADMAQVLVVEDEEDIAFPLVRTLEREGYGVVWVPSGREALAHLASSSADIMILDLGLPDMDGLDVCRAARDGGFEGGIMIVTARAGELDRVVGLDFGADDYLSKPFGLAELQARVRALLRRSQASRRAGRGRRPSTRRRCASTPTPAA